MSDRAPAGLPPGMAAGIAAGLGAGAFWGTTFVAPLVAPGFWSVDYTAGRFIACALFFCIGEPTSSAFGAPNLLAQRIAELCPFQLHGTYASTEMATACTEAAPFAGHVVADELMHIEVLDEQGDPVPEGEAGEVVATPF